MNKTIDITKYLTNERPTIKLAEDKVYEVDDRKNTVLLLNKKMESADLNDLEFIDEIFELLLGKEARKEIDEMDLSFSAYQTILVAAMAAVLGEDFEVAEARFREDAAQV